MSVLRQHIEGWGAMDVTTEIKGLTWGPGCGLRRVGRRVTARYEVY